MEIIVNVFIRLDILVFFDESPFKKFNKMCDYYSITSLITSYLWIYGVLPKKIGERLQIVR